MKKALVADDTKNIRMLLSTFLELEGYEVDTAKDGIHALELLKRGIYDLAFLDIKMPEMSGTEVLRRMNEIGLEIPVIIMTAYATVRNAIECTKLGCVAYLQKPFTIDKIKVIFESVREKEIEALLSTERLIEDAKLLINQERYIEALNKLKIAISKKLSNPDIYILISIVYQHIGNSELAEKFRKIYDILSV